MYCRESKRICTIDHRIEQMENHMEDNDIPKFCTYRGEIEFEGTLIQADIFIDNKMLEDKNNGVKLKTRVLSVSQSFIDSNSETYRIGLMCSNDLRI